ncbi:MAG: sulfite exporter TauE/SafE family protein [Limnobacter sp.]|uniref:sulfite exporter TauE/SafE family protein n=1 Tax=Limnobacter sp. TaxID=2003368 RepID=UPI0022C94ACA|nr:sulfite exporter TauE/SafE family protein [Limnobacter sp.]MCZ8014708.1 sulfite exporter TauE/SafE family protein [Limnobacter sp.]
MEFSNYSLIVGVAFLVAGFVKGVTGMGLPPIAIGLMAVVVPPVQAAALIVVPSMVSNVWQMLVGPSMFGATRRFGTLLLMVCIGAAFGVGVLTGESPAYATLALGLVLFVYALLGLFKFNMLVSPRNERWASPLVGGLTGFLAGATGVSSVPSAPYMNSLGLDKDALLQALGLVFTVGTFAMAVGLYLKGRFELTAAWESTLCLIPTMLGVVTGQKCRAMLSADTFKTVFFAGLFALGLYMIVRFVWL